MKSTASRFLTITLLTAAMTAATAHAAGRPGARPKVVKTSPASRAASEHRGGSVGQLRGAAPRALATRTYRDRVRSWKAVRTFAAANGIKRGAGISREGGLEAALRAAGEGSRIYIMGSSWNGRPMRRAARNVFYSPSEITLAVAELKNGKVTMVDAGTGEPVSFNVNNGLEQSFGPAIEYRGPRTANVNTAFSGDFSPVSSTLVRGFNGGELYLVPPALANRAPRVGDQPARTRITGQGKADLKDWNGHTTIDVAVPASAGGGTIKVPVTRFLGGSQRSRPYHRKWMGQNAAEAAAEAVALLPTAASAAQRRDVARAVIAANLAHSESRYLPTQIIHTTGQSRLDLQALVSVATDRATRLAATASSLARTVSSELTSAR
jgi:hypothetical protein